MILSDRTIRDLCLQGFLVTPFIERTREFGVTAGLSPAGYDIRLHDDIQLAPGEFKLAASLEHFNMPTNVIGRVCDKSTLARQGLDVKNTVIEPGWRGHLTLELTNNHPVWVPDIDRIFLTVREVHSSDRYQLLDEWRGIRDNYNKQHTLRYSKGQAIAQILFEFTDYSVERPYDGKYQDQKAGPQAAILEQPSFDQKKTLEKP